MTRLQGATILRKLINQVMRFLAMKDGLTDILT